MDGNEGNHSSCGWKVWLTDEVKDDGLFFPTQDDKTELSLDRTPVSSFVLTLFWVVVVEVFFESLPTITSVISCKTKQSSVDGSISWTRTKRHKLDPPGTQMGKTNPGQTTLIWNIRKDSIKEQLSWRISQSSVETGSTQILWHEETGWVIFLIITFSSCLKPIFVPNIPSIETSCPEWWTPLEEKYPLAPVSTDSTTKISCSKDKIVADQEVMVNSHYLHLLSCHSSKSLEKKENTSCFDQTSSDMSWERTFSQIFLISLMMIKNSIWWWVYHDCKTSKEW